MRYAPSHCSTVSSATRPPTVLTVHPSLPLSPLPAVSAYHKFTPRFALFRGCFALFREFRIWGFTRFAAMSRMFRVCFACRFASSCPQRYDQWSRNELPSIRKVFDLLLPPSPSRYRLSSAFVMCSIKHSRFPKVLERKFCLLADCRLLLCWVLCGSCGCG